MRCPDCNRFVANEETDPEVELDLNGEEVTASVRIVNACSDCSSELSEASFDFSESIDEAIIKAHNGEGHDLEVEESAAERESRTEGKGRGCRTFYGARVDWALKCACQAEALVTGSFQDDCQASSMDSLV